MKGWRSIRGSLACKSVQMYSLQHDLLGRLIKLSRPVKGSGARALGPAWEVSWSLSSGAPMRPSIPGRVGQLAVIQGLPSQLEQGLKSQDREHGQQGAPLQEPVCRGRLGRLEQSVGLRQKPSSALCYPHHPRPIMPPTKPSWHGRVGGGSAKAAGSPSLCAPTCRRRCSESW